MACFRPRECFYRRDGGRVKFAEPIGGDEQGLYRRILIPCRQCEGCAEAHAREWAVRCVHESKMHARNCFVTLTYDHAHVPRNGSLNKSDWQKFMRRLRKRFPELRIRFFMCGEYGSLNKRPHYHACLFGIDFDDKVLFSKGNSGKPQYTSAVLTELWGNGIATVCELNSATAGYASRYCAKKLSPQDRRFNGLMPEFILASNKPGIGHDFVLKFERDMYWPNGQSGVTFPGGQEVCPPGYYDRMMREKYGEEYYDLVKDMRMQRARVSFADRTMARMEVRRQVAIARHAALRVPRTGV